MYLEHGFNPTEVLGPDVQDIVKREFDSEVVPESIKVRIGNITRKKVSSKRECVLFSQTKIGQTLSGRSRYYATQEGTFPFPHFVTNYDSATGKIEETPKVDRWETVYEIDYSPEAIQKILDSNEFDDEEIGLTVDTGQIKIAVSLSHLQDFINLPLDELVQKIEPSNNRPMANY